MGDPLGQVDRAICEATNNMQLPMRGLSKNLEGARKSLSDGITANKKALKPSIFHLPCLGYASSSEMWKKERHNVDSVRIKTCLVAEFSFCEFSRTDNAQCLPGAFLLPCNLLLNS